LTAIGTLVGILSFGAYLFEKGYGLSSFFSAAVEQDEDVYLVVEFNNNSKQELTVYKRGEAFYWHPGPGAYHEVYTFEITHTENNKDLDKGLVIPANSREKVTIRLLPTTKVRKFLEQGHMDISLYFRGVNVNQFSPNVAFSKENLEGAYVPVNLEINKS
jgi:hypothetical protein